MKKKVLIGAIILVVILQCLVWILISDAQAECYYTITMYQNGKVVKQWKAESKEIEIKTKADVEIDTEERNVYIWKEGVVVESIPNTTTSSKSGNEPFKKK